MGFKEAFEKYREKKKQEKEEFKAMERDLRFKRKLEQKMKSPAQKEYEFYQKEKERDDLKKRLEMERKERAERLKRLSNPFNKVNLLHEKIDLMKSPKVKNKINLMRFN